MLDDNYARLNKRSRFPQIPNIIAENITDNMNNINYNDECKQSQNDIKINSLDEFESFIERFVTCLDDFQLSERFALFLLCLLAIIYD